MKVVADNRKARFRYHILEKYEAGIMLRGSEVKSIREGKLNLKDGYCVFRGDELYMINVHISPYKPAGKLNHEPERSRKLLLKRYELNRISGRLGEKGLTLVPLRVYLTDKGLVKIEVGVCKGKKLYDKRETLKKRAIERDIQRDLKGR